MKLLCHLALIAAVVMSLTVESTDAAVTYTSAGSVYTQDFNSLAASGSTNVWANDSTLTGWYWVRTNPPASLLTPATYTAANGTSPAQGSILSLGNSSDRALGGQNNNTVGQLIQYGIAFTNSTGLTLDQFTLSYKGEQWRVISGTGINDKLTFEYQVFEAGMGSLTAASGWTSIQELDFLAPVTSTSSNSAVDGNAAGQTSLTGANSIALNWNSGQELWLRWTDTNAQEVNNPQLGMLGIDDVVFAATVPEPGIPLLFAAALMGFALVRRHKA